MHTQFSLARMLQAVAVIAVICSLFAQLRWPSALFVLSGMNLVVGFWFWYRGRAQLRTLALATFALIIATLFFTDWGLSSPQPRVRVAVLPLIAACFTQVLTIVLWLFAAPSKFDDRAAEEEDIDNSTGPP